MSLPMDTGYYKFERYFAFDGKMAFRYPVPIDKQPTPYEAYSNSELVAVSCTTIRPSFYNFIQKHKDKIEEKYSVEVEVESNKKNVEVYIKGKECKKAFKNLFELCLNSNVYNFYICFPILGGRFVTQFEEFRSKYQNKFLGTKWEKRPHITLKMLNIVTNGHLMSIGNALGRAALQIRESSILTKPYTLNLGKLDSFQVDNKKASNAIFARVGLDDRLQNITKIILDSLTDKYDFYDDVAFRYDYDSDEEKTMTIEEDGSLYIHSFDSAKDPCHNPEKYILDREYYMLGPNTDDNEIPQHPHVTLMRYDDYEEVVGIQGPKTGLVSTFELRARHNEIVWDYDPDDSDNDVVLYELIKSKDKPEEADNLTSKGLDNIV